MKIKRRKQVSLFLAFSLAVSNFMFATASAEINRYTGATETSDADMLADALLIRPMTLVGTVLGTATFIVTLPFSLLGGNVEDAGKNLVVAPAKRTFVHPLGDL